MLLTKSLVTLGILASSISQAQSRTGDAGGPACLCPQHISPAPTPTPRLSSGSGVVTVLQQLCRL